MSGLLCLIRPSSIKTFSFLIKVSHIHLIVNYETLSYNILRIK